MAHIFFVPSQVYQASHSKKNFLRTPKIGKFKDIFKDKIMTIWMQKLHKIGSLKVDWIDKSWLARKGRVANRPIPGAKQYSV